MSTHSEPTSDIDDFNFDTDSSLSSLPSSTESDTMTEVATYKFQLDQDNKSESARDGHRWPAMVLACWTALTYRAMERPLRLEAGEQIPTPSMGS